jgi:cyclohexadienyl dehydratase
VDDDEVHRLGDGHRRHRDRGHPDGDEHRRLKGLRRSRTAPARALLALLGLVLLVACAPPAPAPARPAAAALRAGTSGDYAPLSVWTGDRVEGFAPALVAAFARSQQQEVAWTRFRWPGLTDDLRAGRFDLAADGITVRAERSIAGRFTVPVARGGAVLLVRRALALRADAIDRPGLRVVVNQGGHLERVARSLFRAATLRVIPDNQAVRAAFAASDADAALTNTFEAAGWAAGLADVEQLGPLTQDVTAIWVRADRGDLADRLDGWLLDREESGELAQLRTRWLGAGAGPPAASPVSALLAATAERLALMPFVAAAKQRTGKAVEDPAQEERVIAASAAAVAAAASERRVPPPARPAVDAFFRVQIEAAKAVQEHLPAPEAPAYSLETDLRPAIARISARMARLAVRVPRGTDCASVLAEARVDLASTGLDAAQIERVAAAVTALAPP